MFRFCIGATVVGSTLGLCGINWPEIVCSRIVVTSSILIWLICAPKVEIESSSVVCVCNFKQSARLLVMNESIEILDQRGCLLPRKKALAELVVTAVFSKQMLLPTRWSDFAVAGGLCCHQ